MSPKWFAAALLAAACGATPKTTPVATEPIATSAPPPASSRARCPDLEAIAVAVRALPDDALELTIPSPATRPTTPTRGWIERDAPTAAAGASSIETRTTDDAMIVVVRRAPGVDHASVRVVGTCPDEDAFARVVLDVLVATPPGQPPRASIYEVR